LPPSYSVGVPKLGLPMSMRTLPLLLVVTLIASGACSDAITAPPSIDPSVAARVLPSVEDARARLLLNIENAGVRERVAYDFQRIEDAFRAGDGQKVRYHVHLVGVILNDYKRGLGSVLADGPDVSAIALVLHAASMAVGGGFDIAAFD
jgi:hypothetical protein